MEFIVSIFIIRFNVQNEFTNFLKSNFITKFFFLFVNEKGIFSQFSLFVWMYENEFTTGLYERVTHCLSGMFKLH